MIESLKIENFRCFASVEIPDIAHVNVIVGDNGSGKTALLEALYLTCGNSPNNHMKIDRWRGLLGEDLRTSSRAVASGAPWRDLFYQFRMDKPISIQIRGKPKRSLSISYRAQESTPAEGTIVVAPITFAWSDGRGERRSTPLLKEDEGLVFPSVPEGITGAMFAPTIPINAAEAAGRFSDLDKQNKANPILEMLKREFPHIRGISVQTDPVGSPMLYADVEGMIDKVPLPLVSSGINRWVGFLLATQRTTAGAIMLDEVDIGIYHDRLPNLWRMLHVIAKETHTQIFASTHSAEALRALLATIMGNEEDFRLLRVTRAAKGPAQAQVQVVRGPDFAAALEERVEVR